MGIGVNLELGNIFTGLGGLAKDLRAAFTGKEPIDANKAAELALKAQELEASIEQSRLSVMVAEASSPDPWTSRARPAFLYVMYVMILSAIPMGIVYAVDPTIADNVAKGFGTWLTAIPSELYALFGVGYTGYAVMRTYDKKTTTGR